MQKDEREIRTVYGPHGRVLLGMFGADSTSFTYKWVQNEYPFGHNAVIFLPVFTALVVIIPGCTKIVIGSIMAGLTPPPSTICTENL